MLRRFDKNSDGLVPGAFFGAQYPSGILGLFGEKKYSSDCARRNLSRVVEGAALQAALADRILPYCGNNVDCTQHKRYHELLKLIKF